MPLQLVRFDRREQIALLWTVLKWCGLGAWVGVVCGAASALFLHSLAWATALRQSHPWLLFLLPAAGALIGGTYFRYGRSVEGGNNLLLERVHDPNDTIPFRMAPLILIGTVVTHLCGGSAGREGTAVQMGGTLANLATGPLRLSPRDHRILILSGISGGFGSVFGTPLAGTVFGLEVFSVGQASYDALIPCFVASLVGDLTCRALGITHAVYQVSLPLPALSPALWLWIAIAGALFGGASIAFAEFTDVIHRTVKRIAPIPWLRPVVGGLAVIALTYVVGSQDYNGLSLGLIQQSFTPEGVMLWAFALKILFTAVTLGCGFKGGEVTPLFCIGATLGAAFAHVTGQPPSFFAALGFVAVFAGAANTPLACIIMGIELFGAQMAMPLSAACILAYILSGHRGIYLSQRLHTPKAHAVMVPDGSVLRDVRAGGMEINLLRDVAVRRFQSADPTALADDDQPTALPFATEADIPENGELEPVSRRRIALTSTLDGMIRIFLRATDHVEPSRLRDRLFGRPLYLELIQAAKEYGLSHGMVKQTVSGFLNEKRIHHAHPEYGGGSVPLYVELHGSREELEGFCHHAHRLLRGRKIVYKDIERWSVEEAAEHGPDDSTEVAVVEPGAIPIQSDVSLSPYP